jgi:uncharacterized membrane protein
MSTVWSPSNLAATAVFTALVCIATMAFSIYVPSTQGFFNIGESMVFLSAILFGPFVGAFAGGVGSMIADLLLGYPHYALATLVIKACEGGLVGMLNRKRVEFTIGYSWKILTLVLGVAVGSLLAWIGSAFYSGQVELSLGPSTVALYIPQAFWIALGAIMVFSIAALGFIADPEFGWTVLSIIAGGFVMVLGYFLYQRFLIYPLFNIEVIAFAEVPINVGQMIVGATIALPITKIMWRTLPHLRRTNTPRRKSDKSQFNH